MDLENFEITDSYGIISDIHNEIEKVRKVLRFFEKEGIFKILVPGDLCIDWNLRRWKEYQEKIPNKTLENQIYDALTELSNGVEKLIVIPGNHDSKEPYNNALQRVNKQNIVDLVKSSYYEDNNLVIFGTYGYFEYGRNIMFNELLFTKQWQLRFLKQEGFLFDEENFSKLGENLKKTPNSKIKVILSHFLPKTPDNINGPDTYGLIGNLGSESLTKLYREIDEVIIIGGHTHHNAGTFYDKEFIQLKTGQLTKKAVINGGNLLEDKRDSIFKAEPKFGILRIHNNNYVSFVPYNLREV